MKHLPILHLASFPSGYPTLVLFLISSLTHTTFQVIHHILLFSFLTVSGIRTLPCLQQHLLGPYQHHFQRQSLWSSCLPFPLIRPPWISQNGIRITLLQASMVLEVRVQGPHVMPAPALTNFFVPSCPASWSPFRTCWSLCPEHSSLLPYLVSSCCLPDVSVQFS